MAQKDVENKIPIYKLKKTEEIMKYYDDWGNKYDQDMIDWNYTAPKETVNAPVPVTEKVMFPPEPKYLHCQ